MTIGVSVEWLVPEEMSWETLALFVGDDLVTELRRYTYDVQRWCDDGGACEEGEL